MQAKLLEVSYNERLNPSLYDMKGGPFNNLVEAVGYINRIFGNIEGVAGLSQEEIVKKMVGQNSLIIEERNELRTAKSIEEIMDAVGDLVTVNDGMLFKLGVTGYSLGSGLDSSLFPDFVTPENVRGASLRVHCEERNNIVKLVDLLGLNVNAIYAEVHNSNVSKLCETREIAEATIAKYVEEYAGTTPDSYLIQEVEGLFVVKAATEIVLPNKVIKAGKFLKGINFREPDWSDADSFRIWYEGVPANFAG